MSTVKMAGVALLALLALTLAGSLHAAAPTTRTVQAWDDYVAHEKDSAIADFDCAGGHPSPAAERDERAKLRNGFVAARPADHGGMKPVPSGLIHHWVGAVFIPSVRAADLLTVLKDYNNYRELYPATVTESKLLEHAAETYGYRLKFVQKEFGVKSGLIGDFQTTYVSVDSDSGYSITEATKLTELQNAGQPDERVLPEGTGPGFVEKSFTLMRYQAAPDGVYVEVEALTLSRDIPACMRWMVQPVVARFSRQLMTATLQKLRERVQVTAAPEIASRK